MSSSQVGAVIEQVDNLWGVGDIEIALEANPHEMSAEDWRGYHAAGLSRLSLGVQSFNDAALSRLGRDHDGETARAAGQTQAQLDADLDGLLSAGVPHLSTYQLTIEDGTAFAKAEIRGQSRAVSCETSADFYTVVQARLNNSGFEHYEVSNFAKAGHRSQHNLAYWQGIDYVGVGPGAHGRITNGGIRTATIAHLAPRAYVGAVAETQTAIDSREVLSAQDWAAEYLLMGLRIDEGVSLTRYAELSGEALNANELAYLIDDGLLSREGDRLKATYEGRLVLNSVTETLLLA